MEHNNENNPHIMPCLAVPDAVLFPDCPHQFDISGKRIADAVVHAAEKHRCLFLFYFDREQEGQKIDLTKRMGVVATIMQVFPHPDGDGIHVRVMAEYRAYAERVTHTAVPLVRVTPAEEIEDAEDDESVHSLYDKIFGNIIPRLKNEDGQPALDMKFIEQCRAKDIGSVMDAATYIYPFANPVKQQILECLSHKERAIQLYRAFKNELELSRLGQEIEQTVNANLNATQREYYLREKLRVIHEELGEDDSPEGEAEEFRRQIAGLDAPDEAKEMLNRQCDKLAKLPYGTSEAAVIRGHLETCLSLPWGEKTNDNLDIHAVKRQLDHDHYGMEKVKERILELIAVRALVPDIKGQIICLAGPPGVGKTSIARSIAEA
ncbi:MAG: LON peptidase substrate-binding domain-containing protein, partial [Clostridia bacterium]|nr:LON peptidase substrate-binding domain-containing protein [Clostridia bacterium]